MGADTDEGCTETETHRVYRETFESPLLIQFLYSLTFQPISMIHGWIYVLSNTSMPGLLKVGMTSSNVAERVDVLSSSTSVPTRFNLEVSYEVPDIVKAEFEIHSTLSPFRYNENREFFQLGIEAAKALIEAKLKLSTIVHSIPLGTRGHGKIIRDARLKAGLSQREMAKLAGVTQCSIAHYEAGADLRLSTFSKIMKVAKLELIVTEAQP